MKPILETIPLGVEKSIVAFNYINDNFETPWHFHPQLELTYIEESYGTKFIGDYVGAYEPEELVLIQSNVPHCWTNYKSSAIKPNSFVIQWNKDIYANIPELKELNILFNTASKGVIFNKKESKKVISLLKETINQDGSNLYVSLLKLLLKLTHIPYKTLSNSSFTNNISNEYTSKISKVHSFIAENYTRKIYLKEVSKEVNMSEQSFSRFFLKIMGRTFFIFLNEYRINIATRMLLHTNKSVSEIGYACGYESLPFFFKKFKELHHSSPAQYRKNYSK
ncbi:MULTISPECIES: AraC family transcriptional regulator [unclassified Cellulophaga]|uniref:AraC family transcriptional regulator n=1 Tax=unclassified Cellulophaga TaxID=2634405 RepID=UPI0026E3B05E|nr:MULTISPECIES: AraC family transcriptional regulator [unclassified Cellulophaga]MDO6492264.1 AraC family transcriptional regulator [Cellulophaga sp. 2_MG-2023]MDO6493214.1 AraC family transcriptional regulator [Cellulophaga sp. 3_MG-2023]